MKTKLPFEKQMALLSFLPSLLLLLFLISLMIYAGISVWLISLSALLCSAILIYINHLIYQKLTYKFRSLNNLLNAMSHGDYSLRANPDSTSGELSELVGAINGLASRLSKQRSESVESQLLLRTVIDHIDVAILALRGDNYVTFTNPTARRLLEFDQLESKTLVIEQLASIQDLPAGTQKVIELQLGNHRGSFNIHVQEFRESGVQNKLIFITDVRTLLRSEERRAWQSLVRVISHEINNSLSPISSISETLIGVLERLPNDMDSFDVGEGLKIISERSRSLITFIESYKQLAKLPEPRKQFIKLSELINNVTSLYSEDILAIEKGEDVEVYIDPVQFEQVLINLVKNSIEATLVPHLEVESAIKLRYFRSVSVFKIQVLDQGEGVLNEDNLFIPFYSTKKNGSGIGLVLCRQIIEAHNGQISLTNRTDRKGCCATIEVPIHSNIDMNFEDDYL